MLCVCFVVVFFIVVFCCWFDVCYVLGLYVLLFCCVWVVFDFVFACLWVFFAGGCFSFFGGRVKRVLCACCAFMVVVRVCVCVLLVVCWFGGVCVRCVCCLVCLLFGVCRVF